MDAFDTEYVDVDKLLNLYLVYYRKTRQNLSTRLIKGFDRKLKDVEKREGVTQELIDNIL